MAKRARAHVHSEVPEAGNPKRKSKRMENDMYVARCLECKAEYTSKRPQKYCTRACMNEAHRSFRELVALPKKHPRQCKTCGTAYSTTTGPRGGLPNEYCSPECRGVAQAAQKREEKAARKAKLKLVTVEKVDPFKVFDRDGWRCKMCGVPTPRAHRGLYVDDAPELDHVVPLSRGGEHSYRNTQCSCRKCNLLKSNRIETDLQNFSKWGRVGQIQRQAAF